VLRRIFGRKRDEVMGVWRKLHDEELHNLYSSPSIMRMIKSRRMRWAGHVARMGGEEECMKDIGGKVRRKEPLGRPRCRWEPSGSIICCEILEWLDSWQLLKEGSAP
jgi:hypothetical protein